MPAQLKDTTMSPATRTLIKVTIAEDEGEGEGETGDLVERLMGKRPELGFSVHHRERPLRGRGGVGRMMRARGLSAPKRKAL